MTMTCDKVNAFLSGYVDSELSAAQAQQIEEHIRSCADCDANYRELTHLKDVIESVAIRASAPPHLAQRISAGLKENDRHHASRSGGLVKLAYSLPALLLGGRLEYLAGDAVAALVYRHRQHVINLFISPGSMQVVSLKTAKYNGYNIIRWTDGYLSYAAVSDLKLADLDRFRTLLSDKGMMNNPG